MAGSPADIGEPPSDWIQDYATFQRWKGYFVQGIEATKEHGLEESRPDVAQACDVLLEFFGKGL